MIKTKTLVLSVVTGAVSLALVLAQPSNNGMPGDMPQGMSEDITKQFDAVIKVDSGEKKIKNQKIESDEENKNAIFVQNDGKVTAQGITIHTKKNGSRALYAAFGGTINAKKVDVTTEGEHCAAFATDMGEGTVTVDGGKALTKGKGSPVIYSTGEISVKNLTGLAENSEIAVIEGKNSVLIEKSNLSGGNGLDGEVSCGIMLYQSMSGDAGLGTANFTSKSSVLTNKSEGPFFYVTNTKGIINLENTKLDGNNKVFLLASGNSSNRGWGKKGANGGAVEVNLLSQKVKGDIVADKISSVKLTLGAKSEYSGSVNAAKTGKIDISIDKNAKIEITEDSYFNKFEDLDSSFKNIRSNGHKIYYNKNLEENKNLGGRTVILPDGGKLVPAEYDFSELETALSEQNQKGGIKVPPRPDSKKQPREMSGMEMNGRNGQPPKMEMSKLSGKLSIVSEKAVLIDEEGKATILGVMSEKGGKMMTPPDMKGMQPPEKNGGEPPAMGKKGGMPPEKVTFDDLKKLKEKEVEVEGMFESDGTFRVMKISRK